MHHGVRASTSLWPACTEPLMSSFHHHLVPLLVLTAACAPAIDETSAPAGTKVHADLPSDTGTAEANDPHTDTAEDESPDIEDPRPGPDDPDVEPDPEPLAPVLQSVAPAFGPQGGGTEVVLQGADFASDAVVYIGDVAVATDWVDPTTLRFTTPQTAQLGTVSVSVVQAGGESILSAGFHLLELEDATGMVGLLGAVQWFEYTGAELGGLNDAGVAQVWLPRNTTSERYLDLFAPGTDVCARNHFQVDSSDGVDLSSGTFDLVDGSGSTVDLPWMADASRLDQVFAPGELTLGTTHDLSIHGLWGLDDFSMEGVVALPPSLAVDSDLFSRRSTPWVTEDDLTFAWPTGTSDAVVVYLAHVDRFDDTLVETVSCLLSDSGAFTVPSTVWRDWQYGDWLYVYVGSALENTVPVPLNNGTSSVAGISWTVSAVRMY